MLKFKTLIFISALIFVVSLSMSCHKEAKCDCNLDSTLIARVFQSDTSLGKDAIIESIAPDQNFGNLPMLSVFSWTSNGEFSNARMLIQFDLSSILPQTIVKKAELLFYWKSYDNLIEQTGENSFTIYKITKAWNENTVTWNNQPAITNTDSVVVTKSHNPEQDYSINVTGLVQDMINNPSNNYGFMCKLNEEYPYHLVILASSEDSNIDKHPKLVVYF